MVDHSTSSLTTVSSTSEAAVDRGRSIAVGVWLALLAAATFGTSGVMAKPLLDAGWSSGATVTMRLAGAALALTLPAVVVLRGRWHLLGRNTGLIVGYGLLAMAACQVFYFNAVSTLSVGVALLLEYLGPVLVVGWLWVRHGHRPRRWTLVGMVLSVIGLALVLDVAGGMSLDLGGVMWGLGAAVGLAAYFVLSAREDTGLPPIVLAWSGMVVATAALLVSGLVGLLPMHTGAGRVDFVGMTTHWLVPMAWLALVAAALAYAAGIGGSRLLGSKISSFLGLMEVMFAVLFAWLLLDEMPLPVQLVGGLLIVMGVVAVRYDEGRRPAPVVTEVLHPALAPSS
jgi:drug/metabolite transporter (DMT)-like permease